MAIWVMSLWLCILTLCCVMGELGLARLRRGVKALELLAEMHNKELALISAILGGNER